MKTRNPMAIHVKKRKAGKHEKTEKALRRIAKVKIQKFNVE